MSLFSKVRWLVIAAPALSACTAPQPVSNMHYGVPGAGGSTSEEQAISLYRAAVARDLPQVVPVGQRVSGGLLIALPVAGSMQVVPTGRPEALQAALRFAADTLAVAFDADAEAVQRGQMFDTVRTIRSADTAKEPFGSAAYKLWAAKNAAGRWGWTLSRNGTAMTQSIVLPAYTNDLQRLKAFDVAVLNAAADLGAPVQRQPLPDNATGPTSGTGFFVNAEGMMLTNNHVVEGCKSLKVTKGDGVMQDASLVTFDKANDLAVINVPGRIGPYAQFRSPGPVRQGEAIVVFGYPMVGLLSSRGNLSTGIVSALAGLKDDSRMVQISAPVQPGNSGGPVFDTSGNVIAIATGKLNALNLARFTGDIAQNINFAIKSTIATNFLDSKRIKYGAAPAAKKPLETDEISDRAEAFTDMVKCDR